MCCGGLGCVCCLEFVSESDEAERKAFEKNMRRKNTGGYVYDFVFKSLLEARQIVWESAPRREVVVLYVQHSSEKMRLQLITYRKLTLASSYFL